MESKRFFGAWCKYQLNLNWLNIFFRYAIKLLLLLNLIIAVVSVTYKFKLAINQFKFLIEGLVLIDLFLKLNLKKNRQDIPAFHVILNGVIFLSRLNILQDIFSLRNLILPLLTMVVVTILGQPTNPSFGYLFVISCVNTLVAGVANSEKRIVAIATVVTFVLATLYFHLGTVVTIPFTTLVFLWLIYLRHGEKIYPKENILISRLTNSIYGMDNRFLWLDFQILKKSRRLQLTYVTVIAICLLYCYIISTRYNHQTEIDFGLILLIQVYYSLVPSVLLAFILSSNYSYIGLLMTLPDLRSFFITKLNIILLFQFLLTIILYGLNYNNVQVLFSISSIFIFNVSIVTPIMFMGILLTDEKINVFDSALFISPFVQSMYFLSVLACVAVILFLLQKFCINYFSLALITLSVISFFQKERFFRFFFSQYYNKKYKLYKILS